MSINGVLEDLPLADVLQFIHLGRRTGTLFMWQGEEDRAEIGFHEGRIVSAWTPSQRRLGDLLIEQCLIDEATLEEVLLHQRVKGRGKTIGQLLLDRGVVSQSTIYGVIKQQIQQTVFDLVHWRHGYFQFEVDELHPLDDFGVSPEELLENLDLNTQMLVLEATRLYDERHRDRFLPKAVEEAGLSELAERLERAGLGVAGEEPRPVAAAPGEERKKAAEAPRIVMRCQVVSQDATLAQTLAQGLPERSARVVAVPLRDAGTRVPGESLSPIVVLDLRDSVLGPDDVSTLARTRPGAPVVAMVAAPDQESEAYAAGALTVVGPEASVVDGCRNLIRVLTQPQSHSIALGSGGFTRFRRVVFDVQSGLASATMALNLMHLISDSVERAVLFLLQDGELSAAGAFGFSNAGEPLAQSTRGLRLRFEPRSALARVVEEGKPQVLDLDVADLPAALTDLIGRPVSGQVVLLPVLGAEQAISVIYADNGTLESEIEDVEILELATSQVGMAFENELLRRRLTGEDFGEA